MWNSYIPLILGGAVVTVELALSSLTLAIIYGLIGASAKLSSSQSARRLSTLYTTVVRGVPELVMMLLVFYGGQLLANRVARAIGMDGFDLNTFAAGCLTLGFIFGAYFTETFRSAFISVPKGQREAGLAYGMSGWHVFARISFPQMLRFALPALGNNWMVLLKSTAIVSMIGLSDLTSTADEAGRATGQPFIFYMVVCFIYFGMTAVSSVVLGALEKRYSAGFQNWTA
jgi:histidine transport system permease protein